MNGTYPTTDEQSLFKPSRTVPSCPESEHWLREADKIVAAYPDKHRNYHAIILRHSYENGRLESNEAVKSLMAIKELIIKGEYSPERTLELVHEGLK